MASAVYLWGKALDKHYFYELFVGYCKKICFEGAINNHSPQYINLLNELLLFDTNQSHDKFAMFSLNSVPYSKKLYLINYMTSGGSEREKIRVVMEEKGIRILDPSILE